MIRFLSSLLLTILADLASKQYAQIFFGHDTTRSIIPHILDLRLSENSGIAFSMPLTGVALKVGTIILIALIGYYYLAHERGRRHPLLDLGYGLTLGGAIGNGLERVFLGQVTDFISLRYFAIFNVADIAISVGILCILYVYLYGKSLQK